MVISGKPRLYLSSSGSRAIAMHNLTPVANTIDFIAPKRRSFFNLRFARQKNAFYIYICVAENSECFHSLKFPRKSTFSGNSGYSHKKFDFSINKTFATCSKTIVDTVILKFVYRCFNRIMSLAVNSIPRFLSRN